MNKVVDYIVQSNKKIGNNVFKMVLKGPNKWCLPGKFFNIKIPGCYLRRPMGVFEYENNSFSFIYKIVGKGTMILSKIKSNKKLNVLIDLGNMFKYIKTTHKPLLITGGSGLGPILSFANYLKNKKIEFELIVGFVNKNNSYFINEIKNINNNVIFCTNDGSFGFKGTVVDAIKHHQLTNHYYYSCGSFNMLKSIAHIMKQDGQVSLDARMGCGFGACMGCSIKTTKGWKRICKDGTIFSAKEVLWNQIV